ncbi:LysR family transcriptional regulator [Methylobacterium brachythecii]|uniref:DNA-binding transcriptional LysR family regulator n=1 Tax=Methylobacterium brachythecii TaxID=1176177 RepID=A0A7W6AKU9_9HYPH|nr:LysR family transcriptional regulator [Methylobacterium brachythecii]MBB3904483.1 DNA-binding transcriptional LysR family regulator [Methylobacterium brachythecii]GLS45853.1 LysR family transcriptional regulator [Methylobacterium brachythecii]
MDAAWLEDFLALVDLGHFSRAAEQRCITQPAFSRRVRALEDWVGAPLFTRDVLPVTLTPAGERFRPVAEETLRRLYLGREAAREAGRMAAATVRIASTQTLSVSFFPNWIRTIEGFEQIQATINLTAAHMAACEQMMLRGEAQFLLCHDHPATTHMLASDQFRSVHLGVDRLLPVSAPRPDGSGPLFALGGGAAAPIPLLTYTGESGLGRILASSRAMERSETVMRPVFASHLTSVLVAMARDAHGVAWAPLSVVSDDLERGRLHRALGRQADVEIEIRLYRPRTRQSPAAEKFWTLVFDNTSDLSPGNMSSQ